MEHYHLSSSLSLPYALTRLIPINATLTLHRFYPSPLTPPLPPPSSHSHSPLPPPLPPPPLPSPLTLLILATLSHFHHFYSSPSPILSLLLHLIPAPPSLLAPLLLLPSPQSLHVCSHSAHPRGGRPLPINATLSPSILPPSPVLSLLLHLLPTLPFLLTPLLLPPR